MSIVSDSRPLTLGDRLRGIAQELKQETDTQIQATSRILGAAAMIAQNHDQLIGEVVEMVEEDLERGQSIVTYNVTVLKQQFKTLKAAKAHFGIKANSWDTLAAKLNEGNSYTADVLDPCQDEVSRRLGEVEAAVKSLQASVDQVLGLLQQMVDRR
ncbi:MAG: hypothetical protein ACOYMP_14870 [Nodosilinea sp.]